ncbi:hypothetical protein Ait01nite_086340 [Actinoplanes italicus]|uniref:Uncharacterized protein n=1 Tax=Actinoplanes italicus TaxID=113567 RepID=A0A2T0JYB1_9ACTN|nr:hypothetical protein [Actinoplanes italicus]PRX13866.1 hypothetical protein CLV67_12455 [Actinoplanes italicus]GIE35589.1 hypothetical protein Ait01nite_086340 [Actinoplanes italicus]
MIVTVTGPSASGKTTWCRRHFPQSTVTERRPPDPPADPDPAAQAAFWCGTYERRWSEALDLEQRTGLAVCDDDPMKLHYVWSLYRIGEASLDAWRAEVAAVRDAVAGGSLGFADLVLVSLPSPAELRRRRAADTTRGRRNFELHLRLAGPLREWYSALATVSPGRVHWVPPSDGLPPEPLRPRPDRYSPALLDAVVALVS